MFTLEGPPKFPSLKPHFLGILFGLETEMLACILRGILVICFSCPSSSNTA